MADKDSEFEASPSAASLIEGLRDFGYTLETALADVIDNSVTAGATNIDVLVEVKGDDTKIGVLDDGRGMTEMELRRAMRPGSQNPLGLRDEGDLGRFGLGMKTASFSQCRRMTVLSRSGGQVSAATWDLDLVAKTNRWVVKVPDIAKVPWADRVVNDGTLVVWEDLDRVVGGQTPNQVSSFVNRRMAEAEDHLGLVFHRFLSSEPPHPRVTLRLNGREVSPMDPFNARNPATVYGPEEHFPTREGVIKFQAFTLPHHSKVSAQEWEQYAGHEGYLRNQGFYVYRSRRLIVRGTWFGLARQTELTKLTRVRIDLPNSMDESWKINVLKAAAHPPPQVRERLRTLIAAIGGTSRNIYRGRGAKQVAHVPVPVWVRNVKGDAVSYQVQTDHPAFAQFTDGLDDQQRRDFFALISMVVAGLPVDALLNDLGDTPEKLVRTEIEEHELAELVRSTSLSLRTRGRTWDQISEMLENSPPFDSAWDQTQEVLEELQRADEHE